MKIIAESETAYHEAGHAFALMHFIELTGFLTWEQKKSIYITIDHDDKGYGHVCCLLGELDISKLKENGAYRILCKKLLYESKIKFYFAGNIAEKKFIGRKRVVIPFSKSRDRQKINKIVKVLVECDVLEEDVKVFLKRLRMDMKNDIYEEKNWFAVEKIAEKLFEKKKLYFKYFEKIYLDAYKVSRGY